MVCIRFLKPNEATVLRTSGLNPIADRINVTLKKSGFRLLDEAAEVVDSRDALEVEGVEVDEVDAEVDCKRVTILLAAVASLLLRKSIIVSDDGILRCIDWRQGKKGV